MKAELVEHWGTDLTCVNAARVSLDKESTWEDDVSKMQTGIDEHGIFLEYTLRDKDAKLIHYLAKNKHTSCFEHQGATLRLKVPIFIARQIQRHRTFSYNEVSRRYVDDAPEFYWPDKWRKRADNVKQGSSDEEITEIAIPKKSVLSEGDEQKKFSLKQMERVWQTHVVHNYDVLLENGIAPEQARMILPQNMYTSFYMSGNLRAWSHFLQLRLDEHAQKEVRDIAEQIRDILTPLWPVSMKALMEHA